MKLTDYIDQDFIPKRYLYDNDNQSEKSEKEMRNVMMRN